MRKAFLLMALLPLLFSISAYSAENQKSEKGGNKKVVYRKFTQYDFSGQTIQGKIRSPEVFYIFQRKRSEGSEIVRAPSSLDYHAPGILGTFKGALPQ